MDLSTPSNGAAHQNNNAHPLPNNGLSNPPDTPKKLDTVKKLKKPPRKAISFSNIFGKKDDVHNLNEEIRTLKYAPLFTPLKFPLAKQQKICSYQFFFHKKTRKQLKELTQKYTPDKPFVYEDSSDRSDNDSAPLDESIMKATFNFQNRFGKYFHRQESFSFLCLSWHLLVHPISHSGLSLISFPFMPKASPHDFGQFIILFILSSWKLIFFS